MNIRPLDLLDLPNLYRYRSEVLSLDATRMLTRGNPLGAVGFLSHFNPSRHLYTAVANENGISMMGSVMQSQGETFAKLVYLAPSSRLTHPDLPALVEHLCKQAGSWGAHHVIAEIDESSEAFSALRSSGFAVYAWQRMWNLSRLAQSVSGSKWKRATESDLPAIQSLYHQIVPPLLHPLESLPRRAAGFICNEGAKCYANQTRGMEGVALSPLIHPEADDVGAKLVNLASQLHKIPVYLCVRSYQTWIEPVLEDLGAQAGERQAVMVKHLARLVKETQMEKAMRPSGVSVQPSRVSRIETKNDEHLETF